MKKMLICFLLLFVSQFIGYGMQGTHKFGDVINDSAKENLEKSEHSDFGTSQNNLVLVSKFEITQFYKEKPRPKYKLRATDIEEEEDELVSSKKAISNPYYFTSFFSAHLREYLYDKRKNTAAFREQSFIVDNKRYVFFCVFRI